MERRLAPNAKGQLPRGRHKLTREEVARSQRQRILDAVLVVVAEKGYANAGLKDVAAAAGVSTKNFYDHFASLEDAFLAAYDEHVAALTGALRAAGGDGDPARHRSWSGQV